MENKLSSANSVTLDLLRIIAATCVLVGHLFSFFNVTIFKDETWFPYIQSLAVNVFFVLSGFLTDNSLRRKSKEYTYREFMLDRFCRIFSFLLPCLMLVILLDIIGIYLNPGMYVFYDTFHWKTLLKNATLMPILDFVPLGSARPLWTLYIEWSLYICYGFYYLVCKRKYEEKQLKIIHLLIFVVLCWSYRLRSNIVQVMAFTLGVVINHIYKSVRIKRVKLTFAIAMGSFILSALYFRDAYSYPVVYMIAVLILLVLVLGEKRELNINHKLRDVLHVLSGITYPLYLTHYTIIVFVINNNLLRNKSFNFWGSMIISIVVAGVLHWFLKDMGRKISMLFH
ncbi:MAG: acyltransferase [Tyzzerella sp.]|nr:acyltransferase [Tyzzerella sp.]